REIRLHQRPGEECLQSPRLHGAMADEQGPEVHVRPAHRQQRGGPERADRRQAPPVVTLLQVEDVYQQFGALKVLNGISLAVPEGQARGGVGPNGAGKPTLIDIVAGGRRPGRGRVRLAGHDVTAAWPGHRARLGLGRTYQVPRPFGSMTVFENALVAAVRGAGLRRQAAHAAAYAALARTGLAAKANVRAHQLTLLERKRLELARALATQPSLLLLREIAGGLTEPETDALVGTIRAVHEAGTTIVWVEHIMRALTQVVERAVCLADGRLLFDGTPGQMLADPEVRRAYLGGSVGGAGWPSAVLTPGTRTCRRCSGWAWTWPRGRPSPWWGRTGRAKRRC